MTDRCSRWSNILGANRRLANAKSSCLQENNADAACMCVHTSFYIYSHRHVLGLLLRVLSCDRGTAAVDTQRQHILTYYCSCIPIQNRKRAKKQRMQNERTSITLFKILDDVLALANSVCLPALSRSDRHVLDTSKYVSFCRADCAVVCCALRAELLLKMIDDNILVHTAGLIVLCCTGMARV